MGRKLICEYCKRINNGSVQKIYTSGEVQCEKCRSFLVDYIDYTDAKGKTSISQYKQPNIPVTPSESVGSKTVATPVPVNTKPLNTKTVSTKSTVVSNPKSNISVITEKTVAKTETSSVSMKKSIVDAAFDRRNLVGLENVRNDIKIYYAQWDNENFKKAIGRQASEDRTIGKLSFLIAGDELTGKTELAYVISEILANTSIRSNEEPELMKLDLFESALGKDEDLDDLFKEYQGKTVLFEESLDEAFMDKDGKVSFDANKFNDILYAVKHLDGKVTVIFELSKALMESLYTHNTRLQDYFHKLIIENYSEDELIEFTKKRIENDLKYKLDSEACIQLKNRIRMTSFEDYSQGRFIMDLFQEARNNMEKRFNNACNISKEDKYTIRKEDIPNRSFNKEEAKKILGEIDAMVGQSGVKKYAHQIYKTALTNEDRVNQGKPVIKCEQPNFIIEGEPGVGKSTTCEKLARLLWACGLISSKEAYFVSVEDLQDKAVGGTPEKVKQTFKKAKGCLLVIDEAYTLASSQNGMSGNYGQEVVDTITNILGKKNRNVVVTMIGYPGTRDELLKMNKGFKRRFPYTLVLDCYSLEEMTSIFKGCVKDNGLHMENETEGLIMKLIDTRSRTENFGNAGGIISLVEEVINSKEDSSDVVTKQDLLHVIDESSKEDVDSLLAELQAMIGLDGVKKMIDGRIKGLQGRAKQLGAGIHVPEDTSYNMIFSGATGTGKTTVARLLAKLYAQLGVLKYNDKFIEKNGCDFIGQYVGHSEKKVKDILNEATGGVLYIDEVYQMDNGTVFGQAAIDSLIKEIDARGNELMVIITGYGDRVETFLERNEGLRSRFKYQLVFPAYTENELFEMFKYRIGVANIRYNAESAVENKVKSWIEANISKPGFGNARAIRNFVEETIHNLQIRIGSDESIPVSEYDLITEEDVPDVA